MSPALGRNVALDFAEFLFESIQTGLDRLLPCDVGCQLFRVYAEVLRLRVTPVSHRSQEPYEMPRQEVSRF